MARFAALLILVSQLLLLRIVFDTTGPPSTWFTFVGHPLVAAGAVLGIWALTRRLIQEAHEHKTAEREDH